MGGSRGDRGRRPAARRRRPALRGARALALPLGAAAILGIAAGCAAPDEASVERRIEQTRRFLVEEARPTAAGPLAPEEAARLAELAARARAEAPWGAAIPDAIFERYVAAPVSLGEPDATPARTRAALRELVLPLVAKASDPADPGAVAVAVNDGLWRAAAIGFSHDPGPDPDPPPLEALASRTVSCVSASILLVAACRAVAVPARVVGIPAWAPAADPAKTVRGYHQWVEIWTGSWRHLGAYDRGVLDRGWYADRAAATDASRPRHRIFAAASVVSPGHFPLPWARSDRTVPGRDVTAFYTRRREVRIELPEEPAGLIAELVHDGEIVAAATAARPSVVLAAGERYRWRLVDRRGRERAAGEVVLDAGATTLRLP